MTRRGIEATLQVTEDDLDFLPREKFDVDEQRLYSGRKRGSFLVFLNGPERGSVVGLHQKRMVLGRDSDCDIVLDKSYVSKKQAEIVISGQKAAITDYGSTNGTFVNDVQIKRTELKDKDEIKIGHLIFKYYCIDLNAEAAKKPVAVGGDQPESSFYRQVFQVIQPHFGSMTAQFLNRQISAHVGKTPETITSADKETLARWVEISAGLLLDERVAARLAGKILLL